MAGLSDFITNTATQATTMPTWYDTAQQNIVNKASTAAGQMPSLQNTVAGGAINQLSGAQNPFYQAQSTLNTIGQGAANPWLTGANGQVTPNTNTAMGGLFQAQNQQLNQMMPNYTAPVEGANIASGNFGSLRGQTAVDKAKADAFSNLTSQQMQEALQNQQTGVQAGVGESSAGSQGVQAMTTLGQAQQSDPFMAASNLGKIVGGISAPTTVTNATQLSPLNQIGSIMAALPATEAGANAVLGALGLGDLKTIFGKLTGGGTGTGGGNSPLFDFTNPFGGNYGPLPSGGNITDNTGTGTTTDTTGTGTTTDTSQVDNSGQGIY